MCLSVSEIFGMYEVLLEVLFLDENERGFKSWVRCERIEGEMQDLIILMIWFWITVIYY